MYVIQRSIVTNAPPSTVFRIYRDVVQWNQWDPDTRASHLSDGLTLGSRGTLTPAKGRTVPMEVTSVVEDESFRVTSRTWLFRLDFDHWLEPVENGTRVTHRVTIAGLLKPLLVLLVGRQVRDRLPVTLRNLSRHAERFHHLEN